VLGDDHSRMSTVSIKLGGGLTIASQN